MNDRKSDELLFNGRLQVETARAALAMTGVNSDAEERLRTFIDVFDLMNPNADTHSPLDYI